MRLFLRSLLFTFFAITLNSVTAFSQTATIKTDQLDYPPGSTVIITGTGWQPEETVTLQVLHEGETGDNEISGAHAPFTAIADGSGNISSTWTVPYDEDELGATLLLTAVGGSSGLTAQWTFTDALPDITASPASGSSSGGYQVTLTATSPSSFNSGGAPYSVTIDGVPVSPIVVVSAKVITFTAPAHAAGNVSIVVNGKNGPATNATNFTYGKADQTITFGNLGAKIYGDAAFPLGATSSSGLTVSYSSSNTNVATVSGNTLTIVGAGSTTITASQAGNDNYNAATSVDQTFTVNKANQIITWANPADITYGTLLSATQLNAVVTGVTGGSATGVVTYTPAAGTLLNAGASQTLHVDVAATGNYNAASKDVSINVNKAEQTITWANPADITYGTLLSATQLNAVVTGVTGGSPTGAVTYTPAAGTLLNAGASQTLHVDVAATGNYNAASKEVSINVNKAEQTITWNNPADITYGTLLSGTQLNAVVTGVTGGSATGAVTYTPAAGTLLNAGASQTLHVDVAATGNYNAASKEVSINVNKAEQTITWANPADITYGTLLSATQLNAVVTGVTGGSATGVVTYTPAAGTLLNAGASQTLHVDVAATGNYNAASKDVSINVNKAEQTITWANPADITYGTLLSATQLNAVVTGVTGGSPTGAVTYTPAAGTLLNAGASQTLHVDVAATGNYNAASKEVSINVNKAEQTITWNNPADITYGTLLSGTQLNAVVTGITGGSATGVVTYTPAAGTLLNAGASQTLHVDVAATGNYNAASKDVSINVNKAEQTITWANPADITYGTLLSATQLNAVVTGVTGGSPTGAVTYTPAAGTLLNAGASQTLHVDVAATGNYNAASKEVSINVNKAEQTITWNNPADITYGTLLSGTQLNAVVTGVTGGSATGAVTYTPAAGTLLNAGASQTLHVDVAATGNYNAASKEVSINVNKAEQTITWANPADITYGTLLSGTQLNAVVTGITGGSATGVVTYTPAAGTLLNAGASQTLHVDVAATGNYNAASKDVSINVNKAEQTITWANPADITYGTLLSATQLNAVVTGVTGGSPTGAVTYTPAAGTLLNAGASQTLHVDVAATGNYNAASKEVSINVNKAEQTITWNNPADITYGTLLSATQLNAVVTGVTGGSATGAVTYTPAAGTLLNAGASQTLHVDVAATGNYNAASKEVSINVNKAEQTITWANPADITYGTLLSGTQLNAVVTGVTGGSATGVVTYTPAAGTLLNAGASQTLHVDVAATGNYNAASKDVSINVNKAEQTITWANPADITYLNLPSATQLNAVVTGVTGGSATGAVTYTPAAGTLLNAGASQTLHVDVAATRNYNAASKDVSINVNQRPITITPTPGQFKYCGQPDPVFIYVASESLIPGNFYSGGLSRSGANDVGTYNYLIGTLSAGNNYILTLAGSITFEIKGVSIDASNTSTAIQLGTATKILTATVTSGTALVSNATVTVTVTTNGNI